MSRPIVFGWVLWLLASWTINWLIDGPHIVTGVAVTPVVKWTLVMALVGLSTYWPIIRLSQSPQAETSDAKTICADIWGFMLVFQVMLWPARFLVGWTVGQTLLIDLAVIMHATVILLCIILGRRGGSVLRMVMMALCLAALAGPALMFDARHDETALGFDSLRTVWVLADHLPFMNMAAVATRQGIVIAAALTATGACAAFGKSTTKTA
ncbi:MAG: hypothetical protein ACYC26_11030 [Phycisphaerales bacterium]